MSGIAGWIDWERDLTGRADVLRAMLGRIRHRGPDAEAQWVSKGALLGHCKLGIIDPDGDGQPMEVELAGRTLVGALDGEIYNASELREQLSARGHVFRTRADIEVLLHACHEWGDDCVRHVDGMFAFAIWEESRRRLLLARDPLGVKPLFWSRQRTSILFGSEIKAILAHPEVDSVLSEEGLAEVVIIPANAATPGLTPFRDVLGLRPGTFVVVEDGAVSERTYWQLQSRPHTDDVDTTVERVKALLHRAVTRRLVADVPLAFTLSGGIDSSAVLGIASGPLRAEGRPVTAWSVDFTNADEHFTSDPMMVSRDAPFAAKAAAALATEHRIAMLDPAAMVDRFLDAMRARDLPRATQRDTSLILLNEAMKKEVTVTLSGVGSDELFAGYHWLPTRPGKRTCFQWLPPLTPESRWPSWVSTEMHRTVRPAAYLLRRYEEARAEVPRLPGESEAAANVREDMYMTLTRRLPYMLDRRDRMAMVAGVDDRAPFMDTALVEYMWNVPDDMRSIDGFEKGLLRRALEGIVPDEIRSRKKSAFPAIQHPRYFDSLADDVRDILEHGTDFVRTFVDRDAVLALAAGDPSATPAARLIAELNLEKIIQLDAWVREYRVRLP